MSPTPDLLERVKGIWSLSVEDRQQRLRDDWSGYRAPISVVPAAEFVALFRSVGFISDGPPASGLPITVYRGAPEIGGESGISWSGSIERGTWYAESYRTISATCLWRACCPPEGILARFVLDDEVVVDPEMLSSVEVVGRAPHVGRPHVSFTLPGGQRLG